MHLNFCRPHDINLLQSIFIKAKVSETRLLNHLIFINKFFFVWKSPLMVRLLAFRNWERLNRINSRVNNFQLLRFRKLYFIINCEVIVSFMFWASKRIHFFKIFWSFLTFGSYVIVWSGHVWFVSFVDSFQLNMRIKLRLFENRSLIGGL